MLYTNQLNGRRQCLLYNHAGFLFFTALLVLTTLRAGESGKLQLARYLTQQAEFIFEFGFSRSIAVAHNWQVCTILNIIVFTNQRQFIQSK